MIMISLTEKQFEDQIRTYITVTKRGYECKIPLYSPRTIFFTIYTLAISGIDCQLILILKTQKINQLACCLLPFSQVV